MKVTKPVKKILGYYESDNPGTKANLCRMMMHGQLAGTGKMVILPVDQGFEHGPARSFGSNIHSFDPHYHFKLGINSGCSAYAAPLGALEAGSDTFAGAIPTILKVNSSNSLIEAKDQAITGSVADALRLGCSAIGFTIYPGSEDMLEQMEEIKEMSEEAKHFGIPTVMWAYVRGPNISKKGETGIDTIAYAAHMACLMGAHIVKVKLPDDHVEQEEAKKAFKEYKISTKTQAERVRHVVQSCFNGRRIVVFSGGGKKDDKDVLQDARDIYTGGGSGSIIGRNSFQRPYEDGLNLLSNIMHIYKGGGKKA